MFRKFFLAFIFAIIVVVLWLASSGNTPSSDQVTVILPEPTTEPISEEELEEPVVTRAPTVSSPKQGAVSAKGEKEDFLTALREDALVITNEKGTTESKGVIVGARATKFAAARGFPTVAPQPVLEPDDARNIFSSLDEDQNENQGVSNNGRIFGGRAAVAGEATVEPTVQPTATTVPPVGLPWVHGQSRGYAMLYAMHPRARPVVEVQIKTLIEARIRQPMIAVLVDGTFGQDFNYLRNIISRLSTEGRELTVVLYLTNGPTMRKWDTTPIDVLFTKIEPSLFRGMIQYDQSTREKYLNVINQSKEIFQMNADLSPLNKNVAIVMLEDNLDYGAYSAMRAMAGQQLGTSLVTYTRNPCVGCYDGNNGDPQGDSREEHRLEYFDSLGRGDSFTLDGVGFQYPEDTSDSTMVSADVLLTMMDQSLQKGHRYFGLWRHPWQGVKNGVPNVHPDERFFQPSTEDQRQFEITALRHALELE